MKPILVAGATGNVGSQVVTQLRARDVPVRPLSRNPPPDGVRGDLTDPGTIASALDGVDTVFLMLAGSAEALAPTVSLLGERVKRVVFLSSGAVDDSLTEQVNAIGAWHRTVEEAIETTGLEWTFLRPHGFAANTLGWAPSIRADGVVRGAYGEASMPLIHEKDMAAVAVEALTGDGHAGAKYALTGTRAMTQIEQVRIIGEAAGRPARWEEIPHEEARAALLTKMPDFVVDTMLTGMRDLVAEPGPVTSTVQDVTGRPGLDFEVWAAEHAAEFR
ncbi:SDR family oxidoreductase [Amycolatopsis azurea]|uniref:NmrA family protein n=1 Tax=Amycolatopsis azurea DSM 43854 TaxID=1238180 RepID=M2PR07_9PSEU|nr:NAD(P)H-binding protein [Amycolatopsis azurea]EMD26983.1 NmrA family protein [Amycolatopsis azurea DSM 43854]OOC08795.1 NmrA family protein [Amycolatopsis azurea DSM 43854]